MSFVTTHFAHPEAFWLLPALLVVWLAALWGSRQKRRAIARLGQGGAVHRLLLVEPGSSRRRGWCLFLGLPLLLVGSAGPRWGWDATEETSQGHDIVIVLDLSRSMFAEQPSRLERSLRSLRNLADHVQKSGGQRLALVVFAAQAQVLFPLTNDYDHLRTTLAEIEAGDLPEIYPTSADSPPSGTRIGAALDLAAQTFDTHSPRPRTILLLSDGDDPARDDEWMRGVHAARALDVPIHTVGIGDPNRPQRIMTRDGPTQFEGKDVKTKLEEAPLRDIAKRTGGIYVPAHTNHLALGKVLPDILKRQAASEESTGKPASVPVQQPRQGWFLWPALALLSATLVFPGRKRSARPIAGTPPPKNQRTTVRAVQPAAAAIALVALSQMGAYLAEDDWIRQGNAAFAQNDLTGALSFYEKAEAGTTDPGLVAFNKAAVFYRLKRYREAELNYLRCLDDDRAPPARQAQALFSLGTSLMRQADDKDIETLDRVIDAFSACLTQPNLSPRLATDAQYNLETARVLRFRATPPPRNPDDPPSNGQDPKPPKEKPSTPQKNKSTKQGNTPSQDDPDKNQGSQSGDEPKTPPTMASKLPGAGKIHVLAEDKLPRDLPLEDAEAILEDAAQRIRRQRRDLSNRPGTSVLTKDW